MKTKKEAFTVLLDILDNYLSNAGCNDFTLDNNPEMYELVENAMALNFGMTLEEFRNSKQYKDNKPIISKNGTKIYTSDFLILFALRKELGL
jgi:hypothetical protein